MLRNAPMAGRRPGYAARVRRSVFAALAAVALMYSLPGCLSQTHSIPASELQILARQDPQQRGRHVRVVQNFTSEDEPPEAQPVGAHVGTHVVVSTPVHQPAPAGGRVVSAKGAAKGAAKAEADRAEVWVILAAGAAVVLAVSEGARFDGWVEIDPMHPVHLYGVDGGYTWMPLAHITPETAAWARKAMIRESEGPWRQLGRAPLNRRGGTYGMLMGVSEFPLRDGGELQGFMSHIQFGGFFSNELGLLLDIGLGWTEDDLGQTIFDMRNAMELQFLPLAASKLHAGVFGQLGLGRRFDDSSAAGDSFGLLAAGGGLVQIELTTRLAITGRAGFTSVYGDTISDLTVGLSIY